MAENPDRGIDIQDAVPHDSNLLLPDRTVQGNDLPVEVSEGYRILVDQTERADAGAGKGFAHGAAYPADSEDSHMGSLQLPDSFFSY